MLNEELVVQYSQTLKWQGEEEQYEHDLVLGRMLVEVYNDRYLKSKVIVSGGTALHKLLLPEGAQRFSEDLDLIPTRNSKAQLKRVNGKMRSIAVSIIGEEQPVRSRSKKQSAIPGFAVYYNAANHERNRLKIESAPHLASLVRANSEIRSFPVSSDWFSGSADVRCVSPAFLAATKMLALLHRSKGRDLYDLELLLQVLKVDLEEVGNLLVAGEQLDTKYLPGLSADRQLWNTEWALQVLQKRVANPLFIGDIFGLVPGWSQSDTDRAASTIRSATENLGRILGRSDKEAAHTLQSRKNSSAAETVDMPHGADNVVMCGAWMPRAQKLCVLTEGHAGAHRSSI